MKVKMEPIPVIRETGGVVTKKIDISIEGVPPSEVLVCRPNKY